MVTATATGRGSRRRDHCRRRRGGCRCLGDSCDNRQGGRGITAVGPFSGGSGRRHGLLLLKEVLKRGSQISLGDTKVKILKKNDRQTKRHCALVIPILMAIESARKEKWEGRREG